MLVRTLHWVVPSYSIWGLPFFLFYSTRLSQFLYERPGQGTLRSVLCRLMAPLVCLYADSIGGISLRSLHSTCAPLFTSYIGQNDKVHVKNILCSLMLEHVCSWLLASCTVSYLHIWPSIATYSLSPS
jgi:hypothetical protein